MRMQIRPMTYQQLKTRANPQTAGIPETSPWVLYDTQTYTDNVTTQLTFFAAAQADRSLSNMGVAGQLPEPQFFEVHGICADVFNATAASYVTTAAGGVDGAINDLGQLLLTGRGRFTLNLSDKPYGPFPLSFLHGSGGPIGGGQGTFVAEESLQWANNGVFDGGFFVGGSILIPPSTNFNVVLDWPAAVNITGDYRIRVSLVGVVHRAIR